MKLDSKDNCVHEKGKHGPRASCCNHLMRATCIRVFRNPKF